jgi:arylsulfatase A-like enzyme
MSALQVHLRAALPLSAVLALLACGSNDKPVEAPPSQWPNGAPPVDKVLLVVIDTLREDVARSSLTPSMDRLAAAGARVDHAWSGGSWTVPSVITLLTGRPVREHGWDAQAARMGQYAPLPSVPTLAEVLTTAGWRCDGLYANPYLSEDLGFDRGFASWRRTPDAAMAKAVSRLVGEHWADEGPHFAYVHLLGPHSPLRPSAGARARHGLSGPEHDHWFEGRHGFTIGQAKRNQEPGVRAAYAQAYAAAAEDSDAVLGEVLDALGPHRDSTLVIVTSDHGELLGEHNAAGHGWWLWQPLVHVPLIVDHPAIPGDREQLPAALSNGAIAALVTTAAGVETDWPLDLDSAQTMLAQREGRVAVSPDGRLKGIWDERIHSPGPAVFDLQTDPDEAQPLPDGPERAQVEAAWQALQARHPRGSVGPPSAALNADTEAELEALGYLAPEPSPGAKGPAPSPPDTP